MAEETVRIRLVFENQRILSKHQKKQGLKRSWAVLNPKHHRTVSEFSNHILYTFSLFEACPHGLSLYMDGFVLPPFESSCVLKDKDIVCVKRKKEPLLEIVEEDSDENVCAAIEIEERARICPDAVLIGNEETGGYESEYEEEEEIVPEKKTSKKRKSSSKSLTSKRKKCKLATTEETPLEREDAAVVNKSNDVKKKKRKTLDVQRDENDEENDANATMTKSKKSSLQEESNEPDELCNMSAETKKTPSRSARRKKAKRQWLREKTKQEKEELQQNQMQMVVAPSKKPAITIDHQETEENHSEALEKQQPDEQVDGVRDEVVVPVEVRPGHIRFKPLAYFSDESDEAFPETEPPAESFLWNGNMTKKKGQKWGTEKTGFSKRYAWDLNDTYHQTQPAEAETLANGQIDYEQLVAYTGSVKKGDIIAYRLIELTSSWTPEVSSFRVGKISYYDPVSKMVTLMPVQGYPIEKKIEEDDDSSMQADTSLYNEDGSLEVEFSSLLDVRSVKTSSSDVVEVATKPDQAATNLKLSTNSNGLQTTVKENGKGNPWEELSEAVSAKKAKLSEANNGWNKKGKSSSGGSWRRGGGIGPLMNYLRSQKEI
ncbi:coilin isoform X1 [Brassica napus]|uniref:coilin isoform X1 n=1 Tax=Brassica napus TaxID=3708 RepID=UPI0020786284|nr:coilin isoform X1 [Brassica napus]